MKTNPGGLPTDHPAIRAINGLIAQKTGDIAWRMSAISRMTEEVETPLRAMAQENVRFRSRLVSYDTQPGLYHHQETVSSSRLREIGGLYMELAHMVDAVAELRRLKLSLFRDCDFSGGDSLIPLMLTGHELPASTEPHGKLGFAVEVALRGERYDAWVGEGDDKRVMDAIELLDIMKGLASYDGRSPQDSRMLVRQGGSFELMLPWLLADEVVSKAVSGLLDGRRCLAVSPGPRLDDFIAHLGHALGQAVLTQHPSDDR